MKLKLLAILFLTLLSEITKAQFYQKTDIGIKSTTQSMMVELQFYSPEIVRVLKTPEGVPFEKQSLSVIKIPGKTDLKISENDKIVNINSSKLHVELNLQTGRVTFSDLKGNQLFTEKDYGTQFTPTMDVNK